MDTSLTFYLDLLKETVGSNASSTIFSILIIILIIFYFSKIIKAIGWFCKKIGLVRWFKIHRQLLSQSFNSTYFGTANSLKTHYFFTYLDQLIEYKIDMLNFGDAARDYVLRKILTYEVEAYKSSFVNLLKDETILNLPNQELEQKIYDLIYTSNDEFIERFKAEARTDEEKKAAEVIVIALNATNHKLGYDAVMRSIKEIFESPVYSNNYVRLHSTLLQLLHTFEINLITWEIALKHLNGKLSGKKFHGLKFE